MNNYQIYYTLYVCGNLYIDAKSRSDAYRKFYSLSDSELFSNYDEILEAHIKSVSLSE